MRHAACDHENAALHEELQLAEELHTTTATWLEVDKQPDSLMVVIAYEHTQSRFDLITVLTA